MGYDTEAAIAYKEKMDATIKGLEDEAAALTGKDNKKARTEKSKEASALKSEKMYVDACKEASQQRRQRRQSPSSRKRRQRQRKKKKSQRRSKSRQASARRNATSSRNSKEISLRA